MNVVENVLLLFNKYQETKNKSKEENKNAKLKFYESLITEEIKIFSKSFEEICLERMMKTEDEEYFCINEKDYKKILEHIDTIKTKMNFLLEYKKRKNKNLEKEIVLIDKKYNQILEMDFSITNSIELMVENIPCKKIVDYDVVKQINCSVTNNLVKFENINTFESEFTKSIDITKHNITLEKKINSENILYLSFTNTKTSNDFIINVKQNGKNINVYNGKTKHNAIINVCLDNIESITIYSEADISYVLDTIQIKSYSGESEYKKGYYSIFTKDVSEINNLFIKTDFDYQLYLFDESTELNYNMDYQDMNVFCERHLEKINCNEVTEKSLSKNFGLIVLFNSKNYCSTLVDIFYN